MLWPTAHRGTAATAAAVTPDTIRADGELVARVRELCRRLGIAGDVAPREHELVAAVVDCERRLERPNPDLELEARVAELERLIGG